MLLSESVIAEFRTDWVLSGKSRQTADNYVAALQRFRNYASEVQLANARRWIESMTSPISRRKSAQAIRAFGKWCEQCGYPLFEWWRNVPLTKEPRRIQETVERGDYESALQKCRTERQRLLIDILWHTGLRRSEISRLKIEDLNLSDGYLVVHQSKSGRPRIVPIAPALRKRIRKFVGTRRNGHLLMMSSNAIRLNLQRLALPSAHAWRRGWAVESLRRGVSEASLRAAAGWASGAMVVRYTQALSQELAIVEFQRAWLVSSANNNHVSL
jgi:integrase